LTTYLLCSEYRRSHPRRGRHRCAVF